MAPRRRVPLTGAELERRKRDRQCLECGGKLNYLADADNSGGFLLDYCGLCRPRMQPSPAPQFDRKAERQRGLENLDRLLTHKGENANE